MWGNTDQCGMHTSLLCGVLVNVVSVSVQMCLCVRCFEVKYFMHLPSYSLPVFPPLLSPFLLSPSLQPPLLLPLFYSPSFTPPPPLLLSLLYSSPSFTPPPPLLLPSFTPPLPLYSLSFQFSNSINTEKVFKESEVIAYHTQI